ncbi:PREDICTED: aspartic proteinase-like protein 2 isoform X1 [Fragaria vesca subsp. vesca]|uniref:aspartic proteinase-like protein 2 isoform X1 n=1 Tax=Fragaria vesca subsp. vesca TaxID=101020 RepID=UPI0002C35D24|nr:PREDICTED: aspartic proteinase-like protein 2 isoform X1 [Fragaria vesca subsp. vesca]
MARRLVVLLIYSVVLNFCGAFASTADDHRRPMILPLHLTSPDDARHHRRAFDGRRLQRSEPNAHMRLHDDLLANGYYTTRLWIGTPSQMFALIVDTGSTVTYVPCFDCQECGKHQDPRFQPDLSTTYQPVKCNINCNCDDKGNQCTYERRYAEQSSSSGVLGEDVISFGNESALVPQRAVFGCENMETGDLYSQRADGIMGLGRGQLSVMDQLVDKGVISDSFSLCYGGMGVGGGAMVLGGIKSPPDMVYTHSDPFRSPYYNIELKEIHVAGKALKLNPKVFDQKHGAVLDSGTTYAYFPKDAFVAFKDAIMKEIHFLKQVHGPDPNYNDICFSGAGRDVTQLSKVFPQVDMVFSKGKKFSLSPENYLFPHTKVSGAYCLGIFENGDSTTLLGGILVRNTLVTYDREDNKVGFWKTNCSELWKSLSHENAQAPAPASNDWNSSGGISPDIAPGGLPPTDLPPIDLPGEGQIGQISFDMMLNSSSSMKPNFTELSESIARGLEVKISQVHLKNYTISGPDLLIRWTIVPDESANSFTTEKAMDIILRLTRHEMQLPHNFGSYELVKLKFQRKQSWWEQNSWMVAVGVSVASVLGLLALGTWLVWRYRSQRGVSYEPVDGVAGAIVAEQELQPLK